MSFRKWQKLMAAKKPNAVALDLLMEDARVAGLRPVSLDTVGSLAGGASGANLLLVGGPDRRQSV
jgi:hypothetical protein